MARTRILILLIGVAVFGSCSMFDYWGLVTHRYAVVYGVTKYISSPLQSSTGDPNLTYPGADAQDVAAMLASAGYTVLKSRWIDEAGNVFVDGAAAGDISSPNAQAPSRDAIINDIQTYGPQVGANDTFVFYFSGHGMPNADPSTEEWFVPYGAITYQTDGYYGDPTKSIGDTEFGGILSASIASPRKVVILDTCNSGGFIGNSLEADIMPAHYTGGTPIVTPAEIAQAIANYATFQASAGGISPYNAQVLAAAGSNESCYEYGAPFNHGIMTYFLLQAPSQADLNGDGYVTVLEAFSFVKAGIDVQWNSQVGSTDTFSPHVSGGPVDFVLFKSSR